jgi:hypothetical protein
MRTLLATTFTVLAASGCAASTPTDPVDDEPPPSSRPIKHAADAVKSSSEKDFDITKPGDPRPAGFVPDFPGGPPERVMPRDPSMESSDLFGLPTGLVGE